MRDVTDDAEATLENALSLAVLLAISALAVFAAAGAKMTSSPRSTAYPIKISLGWPNPLDRSAAKAPVNNSRLATTDAAGNSGQTPGQIDGALQASNAPSAQASPGSPAPAPGAPQTAQTATGSAGTTPFLVSDFSLGSGPSAANAIEIRKPVVINGHAAGTVRMRIDATAEVYVRREDIAKLLAGKIALPDGGDQDFVALDQIRDRGIDVRYNAGKDALVITT
jgi:hypothetical protein